MMKERIIIGNKSAQAKHMHFHHVTSMNYQNVFRWCFNLVESIGSINSQTNVNIKRNKKILETETHRI